MKISLAAVSALLLAAFCSEVQAAPLGADAPTSCCFSYASRKIPLSHVQDYYFTSSQCSKTAVIFITRRGRQVCADPENPWVHNYVNHLELN
ncbi:C-C motif chemokine 4-like [Pleurodeles waltl]|uniref:C-C motif chemokine 4-like n=1 Tax=Pleurodeles waltl TaxID=8319 RepID=UPI00370975E4